MLGVTIPPLKHFGPLLVIWGAAMLLLFYIRDIGSSVMFFGALPGDDLRRDQPALVRRRRPACCSASAPTCVAGHIGHIADRIDAWQDPFDPALLRRASGGSYQLAQGLFAQADGGVLGQGFGQAPCSSCRSDCAATITARCCPRRTPTSSTR